MTSFLAEILTKILLVFFVDLKISKCPFEINWPLARTYMTFTAQHFTKKNHYWFFSNNLRRRMLTKYIDKIWWRHLSSLTYWLPHICNIKRERKKNASIQQEPWHLNIRERTYKMFDFGGLFLTIHPLSFRPMSYFYPSNVQFFGGHFRPPSPIKSDIIYERSL